MRLRALLSGVLLVGGTLQGAPKKPVYLGARACGACHTGKAIGHQYALWVESAHSRAYAALARPEALEIAKISGLRQAPQEAPVCLGCHATAAYAEDWEKDDTFHLEDGVQCEGCHGPGSEYMAEDVMRDRQAAMKAGLVMPGERECMVCHLERGSHVAVLRTPQIDLKKGRAQIAHPLPKNPTSGAIAAAGPAGGQQTAGPKYAGTVACGKCHKGPGMGHQYSVWRMSPHARGWSVLGTPRAYETAARRKLSGEPHQQAECLKCHRTGYGGAHLPSSPVDEGVGCEACHGPGSEYMAEALMRDPRAARAAGLNPAPREACGRCHQGKFNPQEALKKIAHPTKLPAAAQEPRYKTPLNLALRPGGKELYIACEASDSVVVVEVAAREKVAEIPVGGNPADVAFSPDGRRAFVSNRLDDTVSVIDATARRVIATLRVGDEPHGLMTDRQGKLLYVLNTSSDDISVFDAVALKWVKDLSAGRRPWSLALSPEGDRILVTNTLSRFAFRAPFDSEVTAIETGRGIVEDRLVVPGANLMMGVDWHPGGKFALATLNRTKTLAPMTRLLQGWTITNGLAVLWRDGRVDEVLLDEADLGFADSTDVACTPDGRYALVTSSGTDRVAVVDLRKLTALLERSSRYEREHVLPNHLGKTTELIAKHIATQNSPRGLLVTPDGKLAFVANSLDDSLTVIDLARLE